VALGLEAVDLDNQLETLWQERRRILQLETGTCFGKVAHCTRYRRVMTRHRYQTPLEHAMPQQPTLVGFAGQSSPARHG
jgi:hypothetical protein